MESPLDTQSRPYLMESAEEAKRLQRKTNLDTTEIQLREAGLEPGMTAVDVGCGTHLVADLMTRIAGVSATGVDISKERSMEAQSKSESGATFVCSNVEEMELEIDRFDFAWSRFLFEYCLCELKIPFCILILIIQFKRTFIIGNRGIYYFIRAIYYPRK